MAADRLTVNLDGLSDFAVQLESIRAGMDSARTWMNEFSGDLGGREVDHAISHFESHWRDGRGRVDKNCEELIKMAKQAVENLRKADDDLASQLRESMKG
ncbi:hypothetical protein [Actinoplanes teichomyceticus]|uniref:Excreted virulence factor EspC (Type VII ESX diderm) n=1 Tax=Actinoplanes teichomyceticus TaxID=1867 RepID=A0A561WK60_ACTTI|nr:hypothetical protein [Actinoplanes teichomyceticus]TWG24259.1 hypothetical protein FHX34_102812 [Actinoplanes teichomyceticus]GIF12895.1 hypothetical protein Ate01nite_29270 [Actinoplanes teichomyceticus]